MRVFNYKINSSVIISSIVVFVTAFADTATNGGVVQTLVDIIAYFLSSPESFKPYLTERIYQFFLTFLPIVTIILRNTNVRYKPPIEKVE